MKKIIIATLVLASAHVLADPTDATDSSGAVATQPVVVNPNSIYIDRQAYIQDPYAGLPSGGGTQNVSESQLANQNIWQKWFTDGTYNVMAMGAYATSNGYPNTSIAANIFAQTGQVAGFSFGGLMTIANPGGAPFSTPYQDGQIQFLPVNQEILPTELFAEYQYKNIVQVDVGRIGINNSPWLSSAYYNNMQAPGMTYQGGLVNVNPGGGWLLTGLAFNQALPVGQSSFNNLTLYNSGFDYGTETANTLNEQTSGTMAIGANYTGDGNNLTARIWGYQFENYANLAYADSSLKLPVNKTLTFNLSAQGGYETGTNGNIISSNSDGTINSTFFGAQAGFNYDWFGLTVAANTLFGSSNSYLGGGLISPYTYQIATDPLYTTSYMMGMVEKSGGNAYKITPSFSFMNNSLVIAPSAAFYQTTAVAASQEYDIVTTYNVQQIKGLLFTLDTAWLVQAPYANPFPNNGGGMTGGNTYVIQFGTSYLY